MALVLVLGLGTLLFLITMALFSTSQDVWTQASRAEGRLLLTGLLKSATAEGWWLVNHPGLYPPLPRPADQEPIQFYRALRAEAPPRQATQRLDTVVCAAAAAADARLALSAVTVSVRDYQATKDMRQGLLELRVSGTYTDEHAKVGLTLTQVRGFLLTGNSPVPRVEFLPDVIAQSVEEE